jgi:hypothetical protein
MTSIHKDQPVTVLRPIVPGEEAFKEGAGEQFLIRKSDGTECVAAKGELFGDGYDEAPTPKAPTKRKAKNKKK